MEHRSTLSPLGPLVSALVLTLGATACGMDAEDGTGSYHVELAAQTAALAGEATFIIGYGDLIEVQRLDADGLPLSSRLGRLRAPCDQFHAGPSTRFALCRRDDASGEPASLSWLSLDFEDRTELAERELTVRPRFAWPGSSQALDPVFTPDGEWVAVSYGENDRRTLLVSAADGSSEELGRGVPLSVDGQGQLLYLVSQAETDVFDPGVTEPSPSPWTEPTLVSVDLDTRERRELGRDWRELRPDTTGSTRAYCQEEACEYVFSEAPDCGCVLWRHEAFLEPGVEPIDVAEISRGEPPAGYAAAPRTNSVSDFAVWQPDRGRFRLISRAR